MRFIAERDALAGVCRNLVRIVPEAGPIADLTGILMEADENAGYLYLTTNNMEIAIQYKCRAIVEAGGKMVINAKLISEMLPLLGGETVLFEIQKVGIVLIQSGNASFQISCLPGTH